MEEAYAVAERVRRSIEEYPFSVKVLHPNEQVTVSLGVSTMGQEKNRSVTDLIHEADLAMYCSKASGKNLVTRYSKGCVMPVSQADSGHSGT